MIGREGPLQPFELIRWARLQARECNLRPLEAHVLLVLATYANQDGKAWPSLKTLALDCGRKPTKSGRHSQISSALSRLEELKLIWTKQAGRGAPAVRELLFDPQRSRVQERSTESSVPEYGTGAFPDTGPQRSQVRDPKCQENGHLTSQEKKEEERPDDAFPDAGMQPTHPIDQELFRRNPERYLQLTRGAAA